MAITDNLIDLPVGHVSWPHLDEPFAFRDTPKSDAKYQVRLHWQASDFDSTPEWREVKKRIHAVAVAKFGKKPYAVPFMRHEDGEVTANLRSKWAVTCVDATGATPVELDPAEIKFGQRVVCSVSPVANTFGGTDRVTCYLKFVALKTREIDVEFTERASGGGGAAAAIAHFGGATAADDAPPPAKPMPPEIEDEVARGADPEVDSDGIPF